MSDHNERVARFAVRLEKQVLDLGCRFPVKIAGGLIGKEQCWLAGAGPCDGNPLLLTP